MSDYGELLEALEKDDALSMWIAVLRRYPSDRPTNHTIREGDKYDPLGILCLVLETVGLDHLTDEEWDKAAPPYRTCQLAGVRCSRAPCGMAQGGQVDGLIALSDGGASNDLVADILERGPIINELKKLFER